MENINKKYVNLPLGIGGRELKEGGMELPAVHIDNEVLWVNEDMELPFKIEKGKPTNVVGFFTRLKAKCSAILPQERRPNKLTNTRFNALRKFLPGFIQAPENKINSFVKFEVHPSHRRSALIGRLIFKDREGRLYRDIDQKGGGHVIENKVENLIRIDERYDSTFSASGPFGLCNLRWAITDKGYAEKFLKYGIRTYRVIAIVKLKEIIEGTKKITIEKARKRHYLRSIDNPVIEIRAYGTKMRISDLHEQYPRSPKFLKDAIYLVAQEKGITPESFSESDYYYWFCLTLGEQMAIMHKNGYAHCSLSQHNITLDCRIVDLDSLIDSRHKDFKRMVEGDKEAAAEIIEDLFKVINIINKEEKIPEKGLELGKEKFDLGYYKIMKSS